MAKKKKCYSGIGGQAVLEGIMMKNKDQYSIAVRKPNGEIEVDVEAYSGAASHAKITKLPFFRGIFNFVDSLYLGTKCLNYSASFYEEEDEKTDPKKEKFIMAATTAVSIVFAIALFMVLPYYLSTLLSGYVRNESLLAIIEGIIRLILFLSYVAAIALMKDIRRVYMYHGAEHKCINCIEKGRPLTVSDVMKSSRFHKRCGTSFLLIVMLISIVLFFFIRVDSPVLRVVIRLALIPVIAGISYEFIRLAGKSDNFIVNILSKPGLWLQRLTTREPDEGMVEVAIAAVNAIFDWKAYLKETFGYEVDESWLKEYSEASNETENTEVVTGDNA